jgi:hypothetical protein
MLISNQYTRSFRPMSVMWRTFHKDDHDYIVGRNSGIIPYGLTVGIPEDPLNEFQLEIKEEWIFGEFIVVPWDRDNPAKSGKIWNNGSGLYLVPKV